ncbi:MAG: hypothetical protein M5U01_18985 [Ardenticatenaceae bacterium]|nr:hypothetical protein [Ardenticatenaceae bacterium]HBY94963.1 hypothetical protein [Chloroflexota bacterium]
MFGNAGSGLGSNRVWPRIIRNLVIIVSVAAGLLFGLTVARGDGGSAEAGTGDPRGREETVPPRDQYFLYLPLLRHSLMGQPCPADYHDPTRWHPLIDPETRCHFNHEHKDDPRLLDDVFGPVETYLEGYSISYPWQTGPTGTEENDHKHESYGWLVLRDLPPSASRSQNGARDDSSDVAFVKHIRVQVHADMHAGGVGTRFHSTWIEVMVCYRADPNDCGIARFGGHEDYGELRVDGVWVPLPGDPPPAEIDRLVSSRNHSSTNNTVAWVGRFNDTDGPITYTGVRHSTKDAWQPIDPTNPLLLNLSCPDFQCEMNGSTARLDYSILRLRTLDTTNPLARINFRGYSDRNLHEVKDCPTLGPDCIPLILENFPNLRVIELRNSGDWHEYDTSPLGQHWIRYPN